MTFLWKLASALTFQRVRTHYGRRTRTLYITFDDGPHPDKTGPMLDLLDRHGAKATFFLTGRAVEAYPALVEDLVRRGHAIGTHSHAHPWMNRIPPARQREEILRPERSLSRWFPGERLPFRPPHGRASLFSLLYCLLTGRSYTLWSVDSLDYRETAEAVVDRLRRNPPEGGDILLFHDDSSVSAEALDVLLPQWAAAGYTFGLAGPQGVG